MSTYTGSDKNVQSAMKKQWMMAGQWCTCELDCAIHVVIALRYVTRSQASCVLSPSSQNVSRTIVFTLADELHTTTCHVCRGQHQHKLQYRPRRSSPVNCVCVSSEQSHSNKHWHSPTEDSL